MNNMGQSGKQEILNQVQEGKLGKINYSINHNS